MWNSVEIRDGMLFDQAWQEAVDVLAKKFELEMIAKDGGYVRSAWKYDWARAGEFRTDYRVRTFLKFSPNNKKVDLMTEAQYLNDNGWAAGTDTRLFHVVKTDIMGAVGRTTR